MKKITLFVAAAMTALSAFAYEIPEGAKQVRWYGLEAEFSVAKDATTYAGNWVSLAPDFADAEEVLDESFNGLAITYIGDITALRHGVSWFEEGTKLGEAGPIWMGGEHEGADMTYVTIDGSAVEVSSTEKTIYLDLKKSKIKKVFADATSEEVSVSSLFSTGDAGIQYHFGPDGVGTLQITKVIIFQQGDGAGIEDVIADSIESGKAIKTFDENGQVVIVKGGEVFSILGAKIK